MDTCGNQKRALTEAIKSYSHCFAVFFLWQAWYIHLRGVALNINIQKDEANSTC